MKSVIAFATLLALAVATSHFEPEPLSDAEIFYINNIAKTTWKAGRNFRQDELGRARKMLGVDSERNKLYMKYFMKKKASVPIEDLPTNFDPRQKWTSCSSLNEIRDQSSCGSCWAFGPVTALTDRICIHKGNHVHLSTDDPLACCEFCGDGCSGGLPARIYDYYQLKGIVTGGQYNSKQGCMPYPLPPCDHHTKGKLKPCPSPGYPTPKCKPECEAGYNKTYSQDKHFGQPGYVIRGVEQIMQELVSNGPVTAVFDVYSDFLSYKSGIYRHTTGQYVGGHSVRVLGYGVENGTDYWLVANSWNTDWGDKGFFKILKGHNECQIEVLMCAAKPK